MGRRGGGEGGDGQRTCVCTMPVLAYCTTVVLASCCDMEGCACTAMCPGSRTRCCPANSSLGRRSNSTCTGACAQHSRLSRCCHMTRWLQTCNIDRSHPRPLPLASPHVSHGAAPGETFWSKGPGQHRSGSAPPCNRLCTGAVRWSMLYGRFGVLPHSWCWANSSAGRAVGFMVPDDARQDRSLSQNRSLFLETPAMTR